MPVYNYKCKTCDHRFEAFASVEERNNTLCQKCSSPTEIAFWESRGVDYHSFPEGFFEHISDTPIYVSDKRQLKEECKKHGCFSPYYMDGY